MLQGENLFKDKGGTGRKEADRGEDGKKNTQDIKRKMQGTVHSFKKRNTSMKGRLKKMYLLTADTKFKENSVCSRSILDI